MTLQLLDITAQYDGRVLYRNVSLTVETGEIVSLVGPSGAGKSTLLRIIAGIEEPEHGRVLLDGRDITELPIHRRGIGMVFQDNQLFPHLNVAGNIGYGLRMNKQSSPSRIEEMLELIGLPGFGQRRVDTLSGGEAKRVALARSLIVNPQVLLLDEPLTGLDTELHDRLLDDISKILRASKTTVVHVTHDLREATTLSSRIVQITALDSRTASTDSVTPPEA
jgi:thiamine transport system ATP-binding protein